MRRLWPMLRPYRVVFGTALAGALVAMIAGVLVPRVTMGAIDSALVDRSESLAPNLWILAGLAVTRAVITFFYRRVLFRVAYDLEFDLRTLVYGHLTRLDFRFYDRVQSGQLISRANSDIRSVQMFTTFAPLLSLNLVSFVVAVAIMLSIDVPLTVVALCTVPLTYLAGLRLRNVVFPMSWIVQARQADLATVVDESVQGVRVVKGFAAEERQVEKVAVSAGRLRWANVLLNDARARWGPLVENLPRLGLAGVLLYGGVQAVDGEIGPGVIVAFSSYVLLVQAPFRFLSTILMLGQRAAASAQRIYELLDEHPGVADRPGAVDLERCEGRIELRDVAFGHAAGSAVLRGCSLDVRPGETVALVGRTGDLPAMLNTEIGERGYDLSGGQATAPGPGSCAPRRPGGARPRRRHECRGRTGGGGHRAPTGSCWRRHRLVLGSG